MDAALAGSVTIEFINLLTFWPMANGQWKQKHQLHAAKPPGRKPIYKTEQEAY